MRSKLALAYFFMATTFASADSVADQVTTIGEVWEQNAIVSASDFALSEIDELSPVSFVRVRPLSTDTVSIGIAARPGEFPSTVRLELFFTKGNDVSRFFCTGTYLGQGLVLTAAHCVLDEPMGGQKASKLVAVEVFFGHPLISEQSSERVEVTDSNVLVHKQYDGVTLKNDIALIDIDLDLASQKVPAANLATSADAAATQPPIVVAGWGRTLINEGQTLRMMLPDRLLFAELDLKNGIGEPQVRADRQAFGVSIGACPGDSGGPLYVSDQHGQTDPANLRVVGVTSFGTNPGIRPSEAASFFCVNRGTQSFFTGVISYRPWIDAAVKKLGGDASQLQ